MAQEVRLVLSDGQWKRIEKLCAGKLEDPAAPVPTIGGSSRRCYGSPAPVRLGERIGPARSTKSRQIAAGMSPPTTLFIGVLSSLPTHTPTMRSGVRTIHAGQVFCDSLNGKARMRRFVA